MSPQVAPEEEATLRVHFLRPLLNLALRPRPTVADWDAAEPDRAPRHGDIVIVREGPRYGQALTAPNADGRVLVAWITSHALAEARKSLIPEMVHPDFAEIVGNNARYRVIAE